MKKFLIILVLITITIVGLNSIQKEYTFDEILEQKNPLFCLNFNTQEINQSFAESYLGRGLNQYEEPILFKDICLIYTVSLDVNDETIVLCNEASNRVYTFLEENSYEISGWEFCFRRAFGEYKSYPQPPVSGKIRDERTCKKLKGFKDNCYFLVAVNNNNSEICDKISSEGRANLCKEKISENTGNS